MKKDAVKQLDELLSQLKGINDKIDVISKGSNHK